MELRHLRYFVAAAEEQNITRAAQRLCVSQPPLSRQIRDLEDELGLELFERRGKSIRISAAGKIFLAEARLVLKRVEDAAEVARLISRGKRGTIRVGYCASPVVDLLPKILRVLSKTDPQIRVDLKDTSTEGAVNGLHDGSLDVAIAVPISEFNSPELQVKTLAMYPIRIALPKAHRLARRRHVTVKDAAREPLVAFSKTLYPEHHDRLAKVFSAHTQTLNIVEEYDSVMSIIAAVEAGRGIAILIDSVKNLAGQRIAILPLVPCPAPVLIGMAYPKDKASDAARAFIAAATAVNAKSSPKHSSAA